MNRKTVILSVAVFFIIFSSSVSADYIQLSTKYFNTQLASGDSLTYSGLEYQGSLKIIIPITISDIWYNFETFTITLIGGGKDTKIKLVQKEASSSSGIFYATYNLTIENTTGATSTIASVTIGPYDSINDAKVVIEIILNSTVTWVGLYTNGNLKGSNSINNDLTQINEIRVQLVAGDTITVESIGIEKYSDLLVALNVYDEISGATINYFDFAEDNTTNEVRIIDPSNTYASRVFYVSTGSTLDAYLLKYGDGRYYTIQTDAVNGTVEALRLYNNLMKVVAMSKVDENGYASMFLGDAQIYTFRVIYTDGTVKEYTRITSPSNPVIGLSSSLEPLTYTLTPFAGISYTFEPSDRILYINQTNTITAKVSSSSANIQNVTLEFYKNGVLLNSTNLTGSPSGGALTIRVGGNFTTTDYLLAKLIVTTDNQSIVIKQTFWAKYPINQTNGSVLRLIEEVPNDLGIGQLGRVIIVTTIALLIAFFAGAGERGTLIIVSLVYVFFTVVGWVHWLITLLTVLAAIGVMVRRGEV